MKIHNGALEERFGTDTEEETDDLIALAGLLSFIGLPLSFAKGADRLSISVPFEEPIEHAADKTFVPGVFFLLGLECIFDSECDTPRWQTLLPAEEYSEKTAGLEHLRGFIRIRAEELT